MKQSKTVFLSGALTQTDALNLGESLALTNWSITFKLRKRKVKDTTSVWSLTCDATPVNAQALWACLSKQSTCNEKHITHDWLLFSKGTPLSTIWSWFEQYFNVSVSWLMDLSTVEIKSKVQQLNSSLIPKHHQGLPLVEMKRINPRIAKEQKKGEGVQGRSQLPIYNQNEGYHRGIARHENV